LAEKINVMFLYSSKGFGGIVRNISLIVNNLNKKYFNITVLSLANANDKDSNIQIDKNDAVIFQRINETGKLDLASIREIHSVIKKHNIDILSCHGYKADFYGFIIRKFYRMDIKLITMAHGWVVVEPKARLYYALDKFVMRYFDKIILVAKEMRKDLRGFGIPSPKIVIINNAIDPDSFNEPKNREMLRLKFGLKKEDTAIGFVGRLSKEKNVETALRAVKEVLDSGRRIKLLISGEGPQRKRLTRIAERLGIAAYVNFTGYQKEIKNVYAVLDIHVSLSLKEGLPNSILEAQSAGIPCIATDIPGNRGIIKDGINGFLVKPKDHKALASKIIVLLEDKELADKFATAGRKIINDNFSLRERIKRLENVYRRVRK